jgi:protein required for attachment to host cells
MHTQIHFTGALGEKDLKSLTNQPIGIHRLPRLWVVAADSDHAHIYSRQDRKLMPLGGAAPDTPYRKTENAAIGRAGEGKNIISARSNYEETQDSQNHESELFLRSLVDFLEKARRQKAFDRLVIAAPPRTLSNLRLLMNAHLADAIEAELPKDLINTPLPELTRLVGEVIGL